MLGWNISVYRLTSAPPARASRKELDARLEALAEDDRAGAGERIAIWQTGLDGLHWISELVTAGRAAWRSANGYPERYLAPARDLLPRIVDGPPYEQSPWVTGLHDVLLPNWVGKTVIDHEAAKACPPDEWLYVVAWDES
jgi:hypothetical protein